ncbi:MAG: hypothetical protein LKH78_12805 [Weizmannia coagulans]|jgi:hypothetical protein|uniref:hypothetical protein n=1 Tax=Heyndrickxia TaxID=2837504 RepID=UPI000554C868|nr:MULTISPECIES: hypothetical protein [Heyndrickxia]NWN95007.1 hypothetical protein [Bacillus sp. (in: firmicutes)]KGT38330.1 hypothetical protein P421_10320 [Heyndrickxia coagulans P38]MCI1576559.1 hypothetical protein [Heyndrickxia coagulans]MED4322702.1 hypothetical protein [Weizmannia sp. CD-2023]MED4840703.1 hypothetical protein [Weizmannia sp. CD-2023]
MSLIAPIPDYQASQYRLYDGMSLRQLEVEKADAVSRAYPVKRQNGVTGGTEYHFKANEQPAKSRIIANITGLGQYIDLSV